MLLRNTPEGFEQQGQRVIAQITPANIPRNTVNQQKLTGAPNANRENPPTVSTMKQKKRIFIIDLRVIWAALSMMYLLVPND